MRKLIEKVKNNKFGKSILLISGGTAIAQIVSTLSSPIITRLFSPEEYGVLTVYTAILGIIAIAGGGKFEWGIPIAKDDDESINLLTLSTLIVMIISVFVFIILLFQGDWFLGLFEGEKLAKFKYFIPVGIFLTGLYTIFTQWALRNKDFKVISKTKINQSVFQNIVKIGSGFFHVGSAGLIIGRIIGQSAGILSLFREILKINFVELKNVSLKKMIRCAKRYKNFPLYSAPGQILNTIGIQLPTILITALYGSEVIGFYGLAYSIVSMPMNLIGMSVADVFYSEAASMGKSNPKELKKLSEKLFKRLFLIGLFPLMILLFFGPLLFSLVFGSSWAEAGVYAQIISVLVYARFIFTPLSRVYIIFEYQRVSFFLDVLRIVFLGIAYFISDLLKLNSYSFVIIYVIAMTLIYLITYIGSKKILNKQITKTSMYNQEESDF